ncbi:hypothetical protein DES42_101410 [Zavarzinia compransoris]|nr:hypothetical protein DES42_101410 [Zavarzinia compransoris]
MASGSVQVPDDGVNALVLDRFRDMARAVASACGDSALRCLLEEEWRQATERGPNRRPLPLGDLEAMLIFLVERIRRDYGVDALNQLLEDARTLGELREAVDNHHGH